MSDNMFSEDFWRDFFRLPSKEADKIKETVKKSMDDVKKQVTRGTLIFYFVDGTELKIENITYHESFLPMFCGGEYQVKWEGKTKVMGVINTHVKYYQWEKNKENKEEKKDV